MCIVVFKPKGKEFPENLVRRAFNGNDDGFGYMYHEDGQVIYKKTVGRIDDVLKLYEDVKNIECALHFRLATHGLHTTDNAHPYEVRAKDENGVGIYMMHNGIITFVPQTDESMSDTWHFAQWLAPILNSNPELLQVLQFQKMLERIVGTGNKLLFLDTDGRYTFINGSEGEWHETGCWVSNPYGLKDFSYGTYTYEWTDDKGHKHISRYPERWADEEFEGDYTNGFGRFGGYGRLPLLSAAKTTSPSVSVVKSAADSAASMVALGMIPGVAAIDDDENHEELGNIIDAIVDASVDDGSGLAEAEALAREQEEEFQIAEITGRDIQAEDFEMEWYRIYEIVQQYPEKVSDFLYREFGV